MDFKISKKKIVLTIVLTLFGIFFFSYFGFTLKEMYGGI